MIAPMQTPLKRRRWLQAGCAAASLLAVSGCGLWPGPRVITLDEAELSRRVAQAFPVRRRVAELLELELTSPELHLLSERNRLALAMNWQARERLLGNAGSGRLAFEAALRYAPQDASLRLVQVRVQQLTGAAGPVPPGADARGLQRLGPALVERLLEDLAVYRLSDERLGRLREAGLQPGAVTVTARGVEITLARIDR